MNKPENTYKSVPYDSCANGFRGFVLFILITVSLLLPGIAKSQVIGNWTFNNTLAGTAGVFNTISSSDFSSSIPARSFNSGTEYYGENGWPTGGINTAMYLEFTLSPLLGYELDISSLVITMRRSNTGSPAGAGPTAWSLRSNRDGYTTDIASGSLTHNYANYTVTPGASHLQLYTPVIFRIYGYATTVGSGGTSRFVFDNIRVNGIGYLLPARIGALTANLSGQEVRLAYTLYQTSQADQCSIERSTDGIHFSTLHTDASLTESAASNFVYTDAIGQLNTDQLYYRIRLTDQGGTSKFSEVVRVRLNNGANGTIKTYIANNQLHINGIFPGTAVYNGNIYTTGGQALSRFSFTSAEGYNDISIPQDKQLPAAFVISIYNTRGFYLSSVLVNH